MRTLVVTGAGGYIGRHLLAAGRAAGWRVVAGARNPLKGADAWFRYRLEDDVAHEAIPDGAAIVHLAAQTAAALDADIELRAADRLIALAQQRHARLIFVSSQTAREDAPTAYGRSKWAIEERVIAAGGVVVRPGLVYGGSPGGLYATLLRLLRRHSVLPMPAPAPRVQPVHVEDLAEALLQAAAHARPATVLRVGAAEPIGFDAFLGALASGRGYPPPRFVRVPALLVPAGAAVLGAAGARMLASRLRSLADLPRMDVDIVALRPLADGVARTHRARRAIAAEGATLLRYVLGRSPAASTLRRYVRCIENQRDGHALALPEIVRAWPTAMRALDQRRWLARWPELDWRLGTAAAIGEASPEGALRFLRFSRASRTSSLLRLAGAGVREILARGLGGPLRAIARPRADG